MITGWPSFLRGRYIDVELATKTREATNLFLSAGIGYLVNLILGKTVAF